MALTLAKAPLVELVAELRWSPALTPAHDQAGMPVMVPQSLVDPAQSELFFTKFGGAIYQHGFKTIERLLPQGMMLPPNQVIYRYRNTDTNAPPVLLQVGPNQFTANALPPYKTWADFRPWVENGVNALIEVMPVLSRFEASVRYIDAFRHDLTDGKDATEFLSSVLGFKVDIPPALTTRMRQGGRLKAAINVTIPLDGMQMVVKAGEGIVGGEAAVIMDTQVLVTGTIEPTQAAVMKAFDSARQAIHDSFLALVNPIIDKLQPSGID